MKRQSDSKKEMRDKERKRRQRDKTVEKEKDRKKQNMANFKPWQRKTAFNLYVGFVFLLRSSVQVELSWDASAHAPGI